ncbi:GDSL-type esterase/lipase family protein [Nesterenkonia flava]|uniref:GDSL-type esterase/lipase family protein n=2 Tax=Nesterenkonia flava TaxID=469799 RepID=A0ABU1FUM7_9MICC|nr:GDSL-type esterase/lipase family protein [Nesterenkonia flava]
MHWAQPQEGTLTYVALGDSAGVGVGVDEPGQGYVGVIARRLAEVTGETVRVVNLSTYGAKAKNVLDAQLPKLAEVMAPDFATCVIGSNDVAWSPAFKADDFARDMTAIASKLSQGTVMGLVPNFLHWPYDRRANKANQAIL